jgi:hypothetical protein
MFASLLAVTNAGIISPAATPIDAAPIVSAPEQDSAAIEIGNFNYSVVTTDRFDKAPIACVQPPPIEHTRKFRPPL